MLHVRVSRCNRIILESFKVWDCETVFRPLFSLGIPFDQVFLLSLFLVLHCDEKGFSNSDLPVYAFRVRMSPLFWHKLGLAFPGASMESERIHVRTLVIVKQM